MNDSTFVCNFCKTENELSSLEIGWKAFSCGKCKAVNTLVPFSEMDIPAMPGEIYRLVYTSAINNLGIFLDETISAKKAPILFFLKIPYLKLGTVTLGFLLPFMLSAYFQTIFWFKFFFASLFLLLIIDFSYFLYWGIYLTQPMETIMHRAWRSH